MSLFVPLWFSLAINLLFFLIAFYIQKDIFTDITYAATFFLTTLLVMLVNSSYGTTQIIMLFLVLMWSLRLGTFLSIRINKIKVDHRFDDMRDDFIKFGLFWLLQAFTVWIVNMPSYIVMLSPEQSFSSWLIIPILLALMFLAFETIADCQKYRWNAINKDKFINKGLWKISRHPNYFAEYSFWWMILLYAWINYYSNANLIAMVGPLYITFTIYKISGVPILEKTSFEKFGDDPNYIKYLNNTPCVIPYIGKKGYKK